MAPEPPEREPDALGTLAERLEYLFDRVRPTAGELSPNETPGRKYSNREIANKINSLPDDVTISSAYVGELRSGKADDPRASHIRALAQAFGVSPGYFVDDRTARRVQEQIQLLDELRQMDVRQVALRRVLRDTGLSEESTLLVEQVVSRLRQADFPDRNPMPDAD